MGKKNLTKEEKKRLRKTLGPMSDRALEGMTDYLSGYKQTQNENLEKAKILLGEDYVNKSLEENPNASHSFHLPEPYASMSLKELRRIKGIKEVERVEQKEKKIEKVIKKDSNALIYDYLKENQGKYFSFRDLMDNFLEDPSDFEEIKYWRTNLRKFFLLARGYESTLVQFYLMQLVNIIQREGQTHYFLPNQAAIESYLEGIKLREPPLGYKNKKIKESIKHFNRAVELETNFAYAWKWLADCYGKLKNFESALKYIDRAIELDPHSTSNWNHKMSYLRKKNRGKEAFLCCNEAIKLYMIEENIFGRNFEPGNHDYESSQISLNHVLNTIKNKNKFLEIIQQEVKESLIKVEKLIISGNFEDALVFCDNLLAKDPTSAMGWFWKGNALSALGIDEEAVIYYEISNNLKNWNKSKSYRDNAKSMLSSQNYKNQVRKMDSPPESSSPTQSAESWNAQGAKAQIQGKFEEALYCFEKALSFEQEHSAAKKNRDRVIQLLEEQRDSKTLNHENLSDNQGKDFPVREISDIILKDPDKDYKTLFGNQLLEEFSKRLAFDELGFLSDLGIHIEYEQIHMKGLELNQSGNYNKANFLYEIALKLDSSDYIAWFGKASALSGLDRFEEAVDCYDKTISIEPNFSYAYSNKALALIELERFEETLSSIEQAIELSPKYSNLWSDKAKALNCLERFKEAIVASEEAIKLDDKNFRAWIEKGYSEMKLVNYSSGMKSLDKALKIDTHNSYAIQLKMEIEVLADIKKSDELVKKSPKEKERAEALKNKGLALLKIHKLEEALECFDMVIKIEPDLGEAWSRKGTILSQMGKHEEAMKFIDRSLEIEPHNSQFLERKALVLTGLGRFQEAVEYCNKALKIGTNTDIALKLKSYCLKNIKPTQQILYGRILEKIFNFLRDNKGKAFTYEALDNRIEKILGDPNETEYCRKNLQKILKDLTSKDSIKSVQSGEDTHYVFEEVSEHPSSPQQEDDDIFTEVFDKYADVLSERDKDLLRDAFSGVEKKKKDDN